MKHETFNSFAAPKRKEKKENGDALECKSQYTLKTLAHDTDLRQIRPVIVIERIHSFPRCAPLNFFFIQIFRTDAITYTYVFGLVRRFAPRVTIQTRTAIARK